MTCPRCHEALPAGTKWCTSCGFQQLLPQSVELPPGPVRPVVSGTPVPTHEESGRSRFGWLVVAAAVVLTVGSMVFLSDGAPDRSHTADPAPAYWEPSPRPTATSGPTATAGQTEPPGAEPRRAGRKKQGNRATDATDGSPTAMPTDGPTPSTSPTAPPTQAPTPTQTRPQPPSQTTRPSPKPTRTTAPKPKPTPTKKPKPKPTQSKKPTPTKPPSTTPTTPPTTPTQPPVRTPEQIAASLPPYSSCGSISRAGHGYEVAHAFWVRMGRSRLWDLDGNGRICERYY